jgi:hypothetical protein
VGLARNLLRGPLSRPWKAVTEALQVRDLGSRQLRKIYRAALS